jgi:hypothetical protein
VNSLGAAAGAVRDVLVGGAQVVAVALASPVLRRRYNRWGAGDDEAAAPMPGDELVPAPLLGYTRALTIGAPVAAVWPWLVQLGQGRGGLYSYDALENLVGCRIRSADRILPAHQHLAPGDLVRLGPPGYPCFRVADVAPPTALVLVGADPRPPNEAPAPGAPGGAATWQWLLSPLDGGRATRLVVRQRLTYPARLALLWRVVEPIAFVMERRMLLGIRRRAQAAAPGPPVA